MTRVAPALTALVPVKHFNERFLREAMASLFDQSSESWRCLVIVEPSDRPTFAAFLARELEDPRVELCVNRGRQLAGALNSGIRDAETEFVAILLGDDRWEANAVEVLSRAIDRHPHVDFFTSARRIVDADGSPRSGVLPSRADSFELADFEKGSPVKHVLCFRRSKALEVGGLDETLDNVGTDDYDFPWVMAEHGARFHAVPECLYVYRDHRDAYRLTTHLTASHHAREIYRILRKHGVPRRRAWILRHRARRGYLRQCLFRNRFDRWIRERLGVRAHRGWRQTYR